MVRIPSFIKSSLFLIFVLASALFISCKSQTKSTLIDISTLLDYHGESLLADTNAYGTSITIVQNGETITKHYGEIDSGKGNKLTDTTLFEIASVTKVFTGTLMAKAVLEGKVNLDDDIRKFLSGDYPNLEYKGQPIKVKDLLGFKSGINQKFPDVSSLRITENDSTAFKLNAFGAAYTKSDFFEDLKKVKLDTFPGTTNYYNELCPELTGYILEVVYQKDFRAIVKEEILEKLGMRSTFFDVPDTKTLLNGYNKNNKLMPNFAYEIWGAGGMLKSTTADLSKFLKYQLRLKDEVVSESRRNIRNSTENWNGYLWDDINVTRSGLRCIKHGGAYGVQNMFAIYPEKNLGVSIVVNKSTPQTHEQLHNALNAIVADLNDTDQYSDITYGYRLEKDTIVFQYIHPKDLRDDIIKSMSVAGSFNNWNANDDLYQMRPMGNGVYELAVPKFYFQRENTHEFRFVLNKNSWLTIPKAIENRTHSKRYNNIKLSID